MKVENISIRAYSEPEVQGKSEKDAKEKKNKEVINGAELNLNASATEEKIAKERQAMKLKINQMLSDDEYNQEMKSHLEREAKLKQDAVDAQNEMKAIQEVKDMVKEAYGVEDDSEEQKTRMLEYDDALEELKKRAEDSERLAQAHGNAVEGMKQALLQVHPMVDASKQANEIIKEALKEEQSTLTEEMKEKYDQKTEEAKQEAKEAKEKSEELHNTSEGNVNKDMKELLEVSADIDLQKNVQKNNILLEEDLKGIEVDETV